MELEVARYEAAKAFLAVIEPSTGAWGDDLKRRTSYEAQVAITLDALCSALDKVAIMETGRVQTLEVLVRLCAKTWMEFSSQPYRLLVELPQGSGDLLSSTTRDEQTITLVLSPGLKRYGNSEGKNLTSGEVVPDCEASVQLYSTQSL